MQVIIFKQDNGIPACIIPAPDALEKYGIDVIAMKDVPSGKPYMIIDASELPSEPQEQWDVEEADLTDGVGAPFGVGTDDLVRGYDLANGIVALHNEVSGELKAYNINTQQFMEVVE
jgi:hypothetical protein